MRMQDYSSILPLNCLGLHVLKQFSYDQLSIVAISCCIGMLFFRKIEYFKTNW